MNIFNNSGELENFPIIGFGSGPGAPPAPTEEDDSVYSKQTVKVLFVVSEGEIETQSDLSGEIFLNDIKLKTFKKCSYDYRTGTASQTVIPGFEEIESPLAVTTAELTSGKAPPNGDYDADKEAYSIFTIEPQFTAVRCIVTFDSSYYQDRDGNKKKTTTSLTFAACPTEDGDFTVQKGLSVNEKSSGPFSVHCRVERPAAHTGSNFWRIKIKRTSLDRGEYSQSYPGVDGYLVNKTTFTQAIGLQHVDPVKTYPNTALLALVLKNAIRLGNTMPEVVFRMKGIKVKIPSNYDPVAHTHTGIWDGLWKTDGLGNIQKYYTANPAWCIYDALTRTKQQGGLGIPEADIDRYSFYYLSQICDQELDTEYNEIHYNTYRYEIHNCFDVREPAKNILTYMLALCDSIFGTNELGLLTIIPDFRQSPVEVVTNADVIDGVFEYSSNDLEDRVSYVNVTYNNPDDRGRTATVTVPDLSPTPEETAIETRYGYRGADVVLVGCASKAQAIRKGRWYLYSNSITTGFVSFKTFMRGISLRLGKVINILDSDNQNVKQQGRIVSASIVTRLGETYLGIQLDRAVEHETDPGKDDIFKIAYYSTTGYEEESGFIDWVLSDSLIYVAQTAATPIIGSIFALFGNILPTTWRISAVELDTDTHIHTITCTQYADEKYTYIDSGVLIQPPPPIDIDDLETPKVDNVTVQKEFYTDSLGSHSNLVVLWTWPDVDDVNYDDWLTQPFEASYQIVWQRDENQSTTVDNITKTEFRIENAAPGRYSGRLYAYNPKLMRSDPVDWFYDFGSKGTSDLAPPVNIRTEDYQKGLTASSTEFLQQECVILFDYNTANDSLPTSGVPVADVDILFDYLIEVWGGATKLNTYLCSPIIAGTVFDDAGFPGAKGGRFVFDYSKNLETFKRVSPYTALRSFTLKVFSRDYRGDVSATSLDITVSNAAPVAVPTVDVVRTYNHVRLRMDWGITPIPPDFQYYLVTISSGTVADSAAALTQPVFYRGPSKEVSIPLEGNSPVYFHVAAVDKFGETSLNFNLNETVSGYLSGLLETVGAWEDDEVDIADGAPGTDFGRLLITGNLSVPFQSPAHVNVKVGCSFSCCPELRKVRFGLYDGTTQYWKEVYFRDGQDYGARHWTGSAIFQNVTLPTGTVTFTITTEVKHEATVTRTFKDVFQEAEVRLV